MTEKSNVNTTLSRLEFAQVCWVVPDIHATQRFFESVLCVSAFPEPGTMSAQELGMSYRGTVVSGKWLTTQVFNGGSFLELVQPVSGQSMFHDFLARQPAGGVQHAAFRLPVSGFDKVVCDLTEQGHEVISQVDHPIARMAFFDTYDTLGMATEIMGVTPDGWSAIEAMKK